MITYVDSLTEVGEITDDTVILLRHETFKDQIKFFHKDQYNFTRSHSEYLSDYGILNDSFMFNRFLEELTTESYQIYCLKDTVDLITQIQLWNEPLEIEGLNLPSFNGNKSQLFPYQQFGIRKGLDAYRNNRNHTVFFYNHATGTGKSVLSMALIQEAMINRKDFDYVLVFTLKKNKLNFTRDINNFTEANALRNEGLAEKRNKWYFKPEYNVFVMNYEKAHFDAVALKKLLKGKRVLMIMDEVQKILSYADGRTKNQSAKALKALIKVCKTAFIVPTSASGVNGNPIRYWRIFDFDDANPLGNTTEFKNTYGREYLFSAYGRVEKRIEWIPEKINAIRHIVANQVHSVRKTDPGVKEYFKDTDLVPVPIDLSDEDREVYDLILRLAREDVNEDIPFVQYFNALRYLCNTPEGFQYTDNKICKALIAAGYTFSSKTSSKMEVLLDKVEAIIDQGDKCIIFSHWTNISIKPIADALRGRRINFVVHHGEMSEKDAQVAQDAFKSRTEVSVFLSSDAGSHGLNFPEAKYVINYEIPHSYDDLMQRCDRIDRATSYHDGITFYAFYCVNTVEEKIYEINNSRRRMNEMVQGTVETLGRTSVKELLFSET